MPVPAVRFLKVLLGFPEDLLIGAGIVMLRTRNPLPPRPGGEMQHTPIDQVQMRELFLGRPATGGIVVDPADARRMMLSLTEKGQFGSTKL